MTAEPLKPLPCPWCGDTPRIRACFDAFGMIMMYSIQCKEHTLLKYAKTESEVIAAWNRRVEPIGNSDELPEWFIKRITQSIDKEQKARTVHSHLIIPLLKWVLSLKKEVTP